MHEPFLLRDDPLSELVLEDRCAPRVRVRIPAALRARSGRAVQTIVHDLSLGGFCAVAVTRLNPGSVCWLTLPGMEALPAEVVWWDQSLVGCAFSRLLSPLIHDTLVRRWQTGALAAARP